MARYELTAVPRRWVKDWMLNLLILALGHEIPARQPLRSLLFIERDSST